MKLVMDGVQEHGCTFCYNKTRQYIDDGRGFAPTCDICLLALQRLLKGERDDR